MIFMFTFSSKAGFIELRNQKGILFIDCYNAFTSKLYQYSNKTHTFMLFSLSGFGYDASSLNIGHVQLAVLPAEAGSAAV